MSELVKRSIENEIMVLTVDNPPVNALSPGVPEGLMAGLEAAMADDAVKGAVIIGGGSTFIAGADIRELGKMASGAEPPKIRELHGLLNRLEESPKPVVAAIHGTALGGGLELAMACHYRVAAPDAKVGQPEVKLGLIPGAGGTQRLPRLAGVMKALEMCAQGNNVRAPEAAKLGVIDELIEGDLREGAAAYARARAESGEPPRRTRDLTDKLGDEKTNAMVFAMARQMAQQKARGMIAPFKAIDSVELATKLPFEEGCAKEIELFLECLQSDQARALIHVFFSERATTKIPDLSPDAQAREIKKAAVIGAGTMGGGIAMVYANAGIPVLLKEAKTDFLERGLATIRDNYERRVKKGKMSKEQMEKTMALIQPTLEYDGFDEADIVVEAVFENLDLKREIFGELDKRCRADAIMATNTSTLGIDKIASATSRPQQVIGHHFFSPANVMPLLEVVRGRETSDEVIATSMKLGKRLRKTPVLAGNCYGFVGNRMVTQYLREAQFLVEEGASPQQVDEALTKDFGMAMGPLAMMDLSGIDVGWRIAREAEKLGLVDADQRQPKLIDALYEAERYGQKTGAGWFRYEKGDRKPLTDPAAEEIIEKVRKETGIAQREISNEEIVERAIYALVNEAAKILEEGYAQRASDIDIIYIFGYGFPPYRGGPMWHAGQVGLKKIRDRIAEFEKEHGKVWAAAPLLARLADEGKTFEDYDREKLGAGQAQPV